jgi:hypothetical protein
MGKIVAAVVVVVLAFLGYTWLFDTDVEGGEMPEVEVRGDVEAPDVDVRGPEVRTGEEEITVPTIDIEPAEDDMDGDEDEFMDDEGISDEGNDGPIEDAETVDDDGDYRR